MLNAMNFQTRQPLLLHIRISQYAVCLDASGHHENSIDFHRRLFFCIWTKSVHRIQRIVSHPKFTILSFFYFSSPNKLGVGIAALPDWHFRSGHHGHHDKVDLDKSIYINEISYVVGFSAHNYGWWFMPYAFKEIGLRCLVQYNWPTGSRYKQLTDASIRPKCLSLWLSQKAFR